MFIGTGVSPVINFGNYELSIVPQNGYLRVDGKYQIFSNLNVPDNLIELRHKLPSQLVDKVFLKNTGKSCSSPYLNLKCVVYKSSSFIDIKNDLFLNFEGNTTTEFLLETSFFINKQVHQNLVNHDHRREHELNGLQSQISKNIFKNNLSLKNYHFLNFGKFNKSPEYFTLDLVKSSTLTFEGAEEHEYQKVGFYVPALSEISAGKSILSVWELPVKSETKSSLKIKNLSGQIVLKSLEGEKYQNIDFRSLHWRNKKSRESIMELILNNSNFSPFEVRNFQEGEIDLVVSISKDYWTNIVKLRISLKDGGEDSRKLENLIDINPYDPLLRKFKLDHTWIVEKM